MTPVQDALRLAAQVIDQHGTLFCPRPARSSCFVSAAEGDENDAAGAVAERCHLHGGHRAGGSFALNLPKSPSLPFLSSPAPPSLPSRSSGTPTNIACAYESSARKLPASSPTVLDPSLRPHASAASSSTLNGVLLHYTMCISGTSLLCEHCAFGVLLTVLERKNIDNQ
jgi:hypothetical protein